MANHASTKKRIRQTLRRTAINNQRRSKMRNAVKKFMSAISKKDQELSQSSLKNAESVLMSSVSKGIIRKETASRKVSRIVKLFKKTFA